MSKQGVIDMRTPIPQVLNQVILELLRDYDLYKLMGVSDSLDPLITKAITNTMHALYSQGVVIGNNIA